MITEWILYLAGNLLICMAFVGLGKSISHNKPGDMEAPLAFDSQRAKENAKIWDYAQKQYGDVMVKGGYALMIINVIAMLCIVMTDRTVLNITGALMLVLEAAYYFGARAWTSRKIDERFPKEETNLSEQPDAEAETSENLAEQPAEIEAAKEAEPAAQTAESEAETEEAADEDQPDSMNSENIEQTETAAVESTEETSASAKEAAALQPEQVSAEETVLPASDAGQKPADPESRPEVKGSTVKESGTKKNVHHQLKRGGKGHYRHAKHTQI